MLLCTRHHTLVHEGGFRIEKDFQDRWSFLRPDGIAVPEFGYSSQDMIDEDLSRQAGPRSAAVEIPPAGGLLSRGENKASEAPPPAYLH
jgi:hypothetical protein